MKWWLSLVFLISFILPLHAFADLKINEFSSNTSSDWIEIHNSSTESAELVSYRIRDTSATNKIDLTGTIMAGGFATFEFGDNLNNGGDKVKLIKLNGTTEELTEEISYGSEGGICTPSDAQSIGRLPNGGVNVVRFGISTKNASNTTSIDACPAPTPTSTPGPTNTPTPGPTSTPAPTTKPSPTPKRTPTPTPTPVGVVPTIGEQEFVNAQQNSQGQLLDLNDSQPVSPTPAVLGESTAKSNPVLPILIIGVGALGLIISLILLFYHSRKAAADPGPINLS